MDEYRTVRKEASGFLEVRRSKFYCYACPVRTQKEAEQFLARIREKHRDARHNVPAYRILTGNLQHCSDDGEPSGTAGRPVLDVLLGQDVTDVCVVITRYFGGVLLGTGGLVRAYTESAERALEAAEVVTMRRMVHGRVRLDYGLYGRFPAIAAEHCGQILRTDFGTDVTAELLLPAEEVPRFERELADRSAGRASLEQLGERFAPAD